MLAIRQSWQRRFRPLFELGDTLVEIVAAPDRGGGTEVGEVGRVENPRERADKRLFAERAHGVVLYGQGHRLGQ